jgi:alkylation response protein AidB-like acyl-CoA dehydrogenase
LVDFTLSEEQTQILDSISSYLKENFPISRFSRDPDSCGDLTKDRWKEMASLGWFAMSLPIEQGGSGYGIGEEVLLFRELGRHLVSPVALGIALAARAALLAGKPQLLKDLLQATVRATVGIPLPGTVVGPESFGSFYELDGQGCEYVVVWSFEGLAVHSVDELTFVAGCLPFDEATPQREVRTAKPQPFIWVPFSTRLTERAETFVSAYLSGVAEAARDASVAYAKFRKQFGKPIGAFQAVKHKCADMALRAEAAWWQTVLAALSLEKCEPDAALQISAAKIVALDAALKNAAANIQVHGGIGYTFANEAHRFLKRAHVFEYVGASSRASQTQLLRYDSSGDVAAAMHGEVT